MKEAADEVRLEGVELAEEELAAEAGDEAEETGAEAVPAEEITDPDTLE